jgi:hypothetical protein
MIPSPSIHIPTSDADDYEKLEHFVQEDLDINRTHWYVDSEHPGGRRLLIGQLTFAGQAGSRPSNCFIHPFWDS